METATLHQAATGYRSACPTPWYEWQGRRYDTVAALAGAMREAGKESIRVTPLEHSGQRYYYGEGGSRYLHGQRFTLRVTGDPDQSHYSQAGRDGWVIDLRTNHTF